MKKILSCLILLSLILFISCCNPEDSAADTKIEIPNEAELMGKYGPKDLTEEQVDSIIKSIKWKTSKKPSVLGSKKAKKGGSLILGETGYPPSLRIYGENSNDYFIQSVLGTLML